MSYENAKYIIDTNPIGDGPLIDVVKKVSGLMRMFAVAPFLRQASDDHDQDAYFKPSLACFNVRRLTNDRPKVRIAFASHATMDISGRRDSQSLDEILDFVKVLINVESPVEMSMFRNSLEQVKFNLKHMLCEIDIQLRVRTLRQTLSVGNRYLEGTDDLCVEQARDFHPLLSFIDIYVNDFYQKLLAAKSTIEFLEIICAETLENMVEACRRYLEEKLIAGILGKFRGHEGLDKNATEHLSAIEGTPMYRMIGPIYQDMAVNDPSEFILTRSEDRFDFYRIVMGDKVEDMGHFTVTPILTLLYSHVVKNPISIMISDEVTSCFKEYT